MKRYFKSYELLPVGTRIFLQLIPFWPLHIGAKEHNLFYLGRHLPKGCTILRPYLDNKHGDLDRFLGSYNVRLD